MKRRIGDILVELGYISQDQIERALQESKRTGVMLGAVLTRLGWVTEEQLNIALGVQSGARLIDIKRISADNTLLRDIPQEFAREHELFAFGIQNESLQVALSNPFDVVARDKLRSLTGRRVIPYIAPREAIISAIDFYYNTAARIDNEVEEIVRMDLQEDLVESEEGSVTRLVDLIVAKGLSMGASDIHIEPDENLVRIHLRLDGVLYQKYILPKKFHSGLVTRIKVLSDIPLGEPNIPHDGRMQFDTPIKKVDIRTSIFPTRLGEAVVLRLLIKAEAVGDFERLGVGKKDKALILKTIQRPHGLILVNGPTGSGKTTTIYTALLKIKSSENNIMTIEDPIEYAIPTIRQSAINTKAGFTFAKALRAALRQDPDIIMVGEIRDRETAELALRASITGHLVISTLHANEAAGTIPRLLDLGVLPTILASGLILVVAQRLARRLCLDCMIVREPTEEECEFFTQNGLTSPTEIGEPGGCGCENCRNTGYRGRIGIYEVMPISKEIEDLIVAKASLSKVKEVAIKQGMQRMFADGLKKVALKKTSLSELRRIAV